MSEHMMPEEYYEEQRRLQEYEDYLEEQLKNCSHEKPLNSVSERWENGAARWYALFECKECDLMVENRIDHDDYLYWKNQGY